MRVLGVAGSLRRASHNRRLLSAAAELLPPGAEFVEFDGLRSISAFDEDDEANPPATVSRWRAAIDGADALLFATPEYNSPVPGALKNAVDWASRPFSGTVLRAKPAAVIGASTGMFGAVWSQAELVESAERRLAPEREPRPGPPARARPGAASRSRRRRRCRSVARARRADGPPGRSPRRRYRRRRAARPACRIRVGGSHPA